MGVAAVTAAANTAAANANNLRTTTYILVAGWLSAQQLRKCKPKVCARIGSTPLPLGPLPHRGLRSFSVSSVICRFEAVPRYEG